MRFKKYNLTIILIVVVGSALDLLTGYYQLVLGSSSILTPGVFFRGLILVPIFFLWVHRMKANRFRTIVDFFIVVFLLGTGVHILLGYDVDILRAAQRYLKILFPILGLGSMVYLEKKYPRTKSDQFLWKAGGLFGLIAAVSVVFFFLSGRGLTTYRQVGFSSVATFDGQNSTAIVLVLALPMLLYYLYVYKKSNIIVLLGTEALFVLSAFLLGTRAAIVGVPLMILLFHTFAFFKKISGRKTSPVFSNLVLLVGVLLIGFFTYRFWSQQNVRYILRKFQLLAEGEFRRKVPAGIERISEFNLAEHIFGIGDAQFELTENDLVDIYGKFGLLTLVPLLLFFAYFCVGLLPILIKRRNLLAFVLLISFTFYITHASLAGHALASAQSNNLFMLVYYLGYQEIKAYRQKKRAVRADRRKFDEKTGVGNQKQQPLSPQIDVV